MPLAILAGTGHVRGEIYIHMPNGSGQVFYVLTFHGGNERDDEPFHVIVS